MVITVLEGHVDATRETDLVQAYEEAVADLDQGILQTFLTQDAAEPERWRIVTVWSGHEAIDAARASGRVPRGVLAFRAAGAEPTLTVAGVVGHAVAHA